MFGAGVRPFGSPLVAHVATAGAAVCVRTAAKTCRHQKLLPHHRQPPQT